MPTKCSVSDCENYYSRNVPFFNVPSPLKYKFCSEKAELSKKRRKLWLDAIGVGDTTEILRICSKHFVTGKPASLEDISDVDWVPTLHTKLSSSRRKRKRSEDNSQRRKDLSRSSHRSKGVTPSRHSRSSKENNNTSTSKNQRKAGVTPSRHSRSSKENNNTSKNKLKADVTPSRHSRSSKENNNDESKNKRKADIRKNSKKANLKKFLSCKVLLDRNIRCTTFGGTNGSGLTIAQKHGYFTSDNVTVKESALNNTVLRIHLLREDLGDLREKYKPHSPNRKKRKVEQISSFGRQIKRTSHFSEETFDATPSRGVDRTINSEKRSNSGTVKSARQMRNRNENENKTTSIISRFQSRHEPVRKLSEDAKTLNRTINKNYRDKIKIKLFPKKTTPVTRRFRNGTIDLTSDETLDVRREILFVKKQPQWTYYLKFCPYRYPEDGTLSYTFQKLVTDVKHMKLPAPSWKIKVIIRQGKISAITFTNKLSLERCVGFSVHDKRYKIIIDNRPALLLGSPGSIKNSEDLETLLDIIQNIESNNPMIFYK